MKPNEEESVTQWIQEIDVPGALISYSYRRIQHYLAKELAPYHLGWGHFAILMSLYKEEGRSQDSLAQSRGFDKTMIAKSVTRMEDEGIVFRMVDPEDRRIKLLYFTKKGRELEMEMKRIGFQLNNHLLADLDEDEARAAVNGIRKIALNAAKL